MNILFLVLLFLSILYMVVPNDLFIRLLLLLYMMYSMYNGVQFLTYYKKTNQPLFISVGITSFCISLLFVFLFLLSSTRNDPSLYFSQNLYVQLTLFFLLTLNLLFFPNLVRFSLSQNIIFSLIVFMVTIYGIVTLFNVPIALLQMHNMEVSRIYFISVNAMAFLLFTSLVRLLLYKGTIKSNVKGQCIFASILLFIAFSMHLFFQNNLSQMIPLQYIIIFIALFCLYHSLSNSESTLSLLNNAPSYNENDKKVLNFFEEMPFGLSLFQCLLDDEKKMQSATALKVNKTASTIFNQPKEFVEKNNLNNILPTIDHLLIEKCANVFLQGTSQSFRFTHPFSQQTFQIFVFPLENNILGAFFTNITREYTIEKEYFDFISTTSHELRTPIVAIRESFNLLLNSWNTEKTQPQLHLQNICSRNICKIKTLVEQILDYQKYSLQDRSDKSLEQINDIVQEVYFSLLPVALSKHIKLIFTPNKNLPLIMVFKDGIETVVTNLVNNAIKYSEKGTILVTTNFEDNKVIIKIQDEGFGMSEKDIQSIFEPFKRIRNCHIKDINGSGLGLSIAKKIIMEHQGYIHVESRENVGSTFTVYIPKT